MPGQAIYVWLRQDRIDSGLEPDPTSAECAEPAVARRAIEPVKQAAPSKMVPSDRGDGLRRSAHQDLLSRAGSGLARTGGELDGGVQAMTSMK